MRSIGRRIRASAAATLSVRGVAAWKTFGADLAPLASGDGDAAAVELPAGGFLAVFATAGATVRLAR